MKREPNNLLRRASERFDDIVGVFSPRAAYARKRFRFGYDVLDNSRLRKKRTGLSGTGDQQLTEIGLAKLRNICRDLGQNNPLVKGLLRIEATGAVGTDTKIQARTADEGWNEAAEQLFKERCEMRPFDVTGRYAFHKFLKNSFYSYRRDGDMFVLFTPDGPQAIEGEQVGTPYGAASKPVNYDITNGVAVSKKTQRVIGYYIGSPNKWGYIKPGSYKKYQSADVQHVLSSERFSASRGEPVLTSSVKYIDELCDYIDAELVAAKVNACFPMMIITKDASGMPLPYTGGISSSGKDADDRPLQKIDPGQMWFGESGESASAIGATRPASAFDPFVLRMLSIIGRPMCIPLMLITGDFSGATFMNARIAYQEARDNWKDEQNLVVRPLAARIWLHQVRKWIDDGDLKDREDWYACEVMCKRWPYVDPFKESMADKQQLVNATTTRTRICARQGDDFKDITDQRAVEEKYLKEKGLNLAVEKPAAPKKDGGNNGK